MTEKELRQIIGSAIQEYYNQNKVRITSIDVRWHSYLGIPDQIAEIRIETNAEHNNS